MLVVNMSLEEIKAYVSLIEDTSIDDIESFKKVLPFEKIYNYDEIMNQVCEILKEEIKALKQLNDDSKNDDLTLEITDLLKKLYFCRYCTVKKNDYVDSVSNNIVFLKSGLRNIYFESDLKKFPKEYYGRIKKVLENILNGTNMADPTKFKFYNNSNFTEKIMTFKEFKVRVFVIRLKENVFAVCGVYEKKAKQKVELIKKVRKRVADEKKQLVRLKQAMENPVEKERIIAENKKILDNIMVKLNNGIEESNDEFVFSKEALKELLEEIEEMDKGVEVFDLNSEDQEEIEVLDLNEGKDSIEGSNVESTIEETSVTSDYLNEANENSQEDSKVDTIAEETSAASNSLDDEGKISEEDEKSIDTVSDKSDEIIPETSKKVKRRGRGLGKKTIARNALNDSLKN